MYNDEQLNGVLHSPGIYMILNLKNNKTYIGQSIDCRQRCISHRTKLNNNIHPNKHLQNAWNKYGKECFLFYVIEYCEVEDLDAVEEMWIKTLKASNDLMGYNCRLEATSNRGLKWTLEQREKMNKIINDPNGWFKNHTVPLETRLKAYETNRNRIWTEEERKEQSKRLKGLKVKDTTNMKIAQRGEKNGSHKLTEKEVIEIINLLNNKIYTQQLIGEVYNVNHANIFAIKKKKSWTYIDRQKVLDNNIFQEASKKVEEYKKNHNSTI